MFPQVNALPQIFPAHATLRPGQTLAFEALAMSDVDWTLEHSPLDSTLVMGATTGLRTELRVPAQVAESGIYFLRATSRRDPRVSATTTLRVTALQEEGPLHRRHQRCERSLPVPAKRNPDRSIQGLLGQFRNCFLCHGLLANA